MSWKRAKEEAEKWLATLPLPKELRGEYVDLNQYVSTLPFEGQYKTMVLRAAARVLKTKGASSNISE